MLDKSSLVEYLLELAPTVVKTNLTITKFHSIVAKHLKKTIPLRTRKTKDKEVEPGQVWVGGTYYSDWDQEKQKCIEIVLAYNSTNSKLCLTSMQFRRICNGIADTLLHEIIHMRQYRRRKFKALPDYASNADKQELRREQSYLGCSDEIDAYSFNIACELYSKFDGNYNKIIDYLNEDQRGKKRRHNSWRMYLKAFGHNHNHPIVRRVKKKVVRYLPFAEIGKPYRNKDWINR